MSLEMRPNLMAENGKAKTATVEGIEKTLLGPSPGFEELTRKDPAKFRKFMERNPCLDNRK